MTKKRLKPSETGGSTVRSRPRSGRNGQEQRSSGTSVAGVPKNLLYAAGTGRGMEVFAGLLSIPIEEVGEFSLSVEEEPEPVSSTCVVFAKSEASALPREGWPKNRVLAAYFAAMARRVVTLLERIEVQKGSAITGWRRQERRRGQPPQEGTRAESPQDSIRLPDSRSLGRRPVCPGPRKQAPQIVTVFRTGSPSPGMSLARPKTGRF